MSDLKSYFDTHQRVVADALEAIEPVHGAASAAIIDALRTGKKVITFGNGGSATQASHLAGELVGRYRDTRRPLPAIALGSDPGTVTCIANDFGYAVLFERQVEALCERGDVVIGLTTSGRSENVLRGLAAAKTKGGVTIALTGKTGARNSTTVDHLVAVPSNDTAHVQEVHLMAIHAWCKAIDQAFA